jgi:hypothetical protein
MCAHVQANETCVAQVISKLRPGMDLRFVGDFVEYALSGPGMRTAQCADHLESNAFF